MAPPPAPAGAGSPADLVAVAGELALLLERETALVADMKIAEIAPLQADKVRLTRRFEALLKAHAGNVSQPVKAQWQAAGKRLAAAAHANERALRVGRIATERLIAAIISAVRKSRRPPMAYSGRRAAPCQPRVAGVAINQRL